MVYGLNPATVELLVSEDKQTWDVRSKLPIADFAVSPGDADTLVGDYATGAGPEHRR